MTNHEYYLLLRDHERAERQYAEKEAADAAAQREAAAVQARADRIRPVLADIVSRVTGADVSGELRVFQHAIADHLSSDPAIRVEWLQWASRAGDLVGDNAISNVQRRVVILWPIVDLWRAVIALHEIAHIRTPWDGTPLVRETRAWNWAIEQSPIWDERCHQEMRRCLVSYLDGVKHRSVLDVIEAERVMADDTLARNRKPSRLAVEAFEDAEFWRLWGRRPCELRKWCRDQPDPIAVGTVAHRYVCRRCLEVHRMNMDLAEMRAAREAQRRKTA
jgi:hypothetical protein